MHRVLFMSFSESASIFFKSNALHTGGLLVTLQHKLWLSVFSGHHFKRNIKNPIPGLAHNKTMSMQCCRIVRKAASRDEWLLWEMPSNAASVQSRSSFLTNQKQLSQKKRWPARNVFLLLFFFFHAFRLLHVPTSRFDYSACTVIDRTITSRKPAAN